MALEDSRIKTVNTDPNHPAAEFIQNPRSPSAMPALKVGGNMVVTGTITGQGATDWFNVLSYGADPTGVNDSTEEIGSAAAAVAAAGGGVLYFPTGTYKSSLAIVVKNFMTIKGDGAGLSTISTTSTSAHGCHGTDLQNATIEDVSFAGPSSGTGKGVLFDLSSNSGTAYVNMNRVIVQGYGSHGVDVNSPLASVFSGVISELNGGHGFHIHSTTATTSTTMNSCYANHNSQYGYYLNSMVYSSLNACAADSNVGSYYFLDPQGVTMNGCGAEGGLGIGITIDGTGGGGGFGMNVNACWLYNSASTGIWVTGNAKGITLNGCVENSSQMGVTHFILVDSGSAVIVLNPQNVTANTYNGTYILMDSNAQIVQSGSGASTALSTTDVYGIFSAHAGTKTTASAPAITPTFANGTAAQLADTTRDYVLYLTVGTAGTAFSLAIGPTSTPANTVVSSSTATTGEVYTVRVPAGWYVKWAATTATLANQLAIGC